MATAVAAFLARKTDETMRSPRRLSCQEPVAYVSAAAMTGPVHALVALEKVLGEEAPRPELGDSQVERADACLEAAVPVAVPAVGPIASVLVGLLVHDGFHDLLSEQPEQRLDADHPVGRPRMAAFSGIASANVSIAAPVLSQNLFLWLF